MLLTKNNVLLKLDNNEEPGGTLGETGKRGRDSTGERNEEKKPKEDLENSGTKPPNQEHLMQTIRKDKIQTRLKRLDEGLGIHSATESDTECTMQNTKNATAEQIKEREELTKKRLAKVMTKELEVILRKRMTSQQIKCLADAGYNAHTDTTTYMRGNTSRKNMLKFAWQTKTEKTKYNWKEELTEEDKEQAASLLQTMGLRFSSVSSVDSEEVVSVSSVSVSSEEISVEEEQDAFANTVDLEAIDEIIKQSPDLKFGKILYHVIYGEKFKYIIIFCAHMK